MSQELLLQIFLGLICFDVLTKILCLGVGTYPRKVPAWADALDVLVCIPLIIYTVLALT